MRNKITTPKKTNQPNILTYKDFRKAEKALKNNLQYLFDGAGYVHLLNKKDLQKPIKRDNGTEPVRYGLSRK